jgi:hypothetical protein
MPKLKKIFYYFRNSASHFFDTDFTGKTAFFSIFINKLTA